MLNTCGTAKEHGRSTILYVVKAQPALSRAGRSLICRFEQRQKSARDVVWF